MTNADTYIMPGSIDVATLVVGMVFLTLFVIGASLLARHHLGILTAIVGGGIWVITRQILANEQRLADYLLRVAGAAQTRFDMQLVRSANHLSPWVFALGVIIAVSALIMHRIQDATTPPYEPLEDQHEVPHSSDVSHQA